MINIQDFADFLAVELDPKIRVETNGDFIIVTCDDRGIQIDCREFKEKVKFPEAESSVAITAKIITHAFQKAGVLHHFSQN